MKKAKKVSVSYECKFDDGEYINSFKTEEEARAYRSEHNFEYISRSIHVYKCIVYMYEEGYGYADLEKLV